MPASVPPAPSLPGLAHTFCSATVRMGSDELGVAAPVQVTVALFEISPGVVGRTVMVIGPEVAPAASEPMLQVTGPVPAQPLCETKFAPAGMVSLMVTVVIVAFV